MLFPPKETQHSSELVKSLYFYFRNTQSHTHAHIITFLLKITQQCIHSFSQVLSLPATLPLPFKCYDCYQTVISLEYICRDLSLGSMEVQRQMLPSLYTIRSQLTDSKTCFSHLRMCFYIISCGDVRFSTLISILSNIFQNGYKPVLH